MLDLKAEDLKIVREILLAHIPNMTVWAYGSRTNGKAHGGSDLDLAIIYPDNTSVSQKNIAALIAALREAFSESNLPILVDVLDWAHIPEAFREEIIRHHEVVQ
jgi:predicted nucleotidyltransferase